MRIKKSVEKSNQSRLNKSVMQTALEMIARRAFSEAELRKKLQAKFTGRENEINDAILKLKGYSYLDDTQLAKDLLRKKINQKPQGLRKIEADLRARNLEKNAIKSALQDAASELDEAEIISLAIERYIRRRGQLKNRQDAERLFAHLARLGFEYELIRQQIEKNYKDFSSGLID